MVEKQPTEERTSSKERKILLRLMKRVLDDKIPIHRLNIEAREYLRLKSFNLWLGHNQNEYILSDEEYQVYLDYIEVYSEYLAKLGN